MVRLRCEVQCELRACVRVRCGLVCELGNASRRCGVSHRFVVHPPPCAVLCVWLRAAVIPTAHRYPQVASCADGSAQCGRRTRGGAARFPRTPRLGSAKPACAQAAETSATRPPNAHEGRHSERSTAHTNAPRKHSAVPPREGLGCADCDHRREGFHCRVGRPIGWTR